MTTPLYKSTDGTGASTRMSTLPVQYHSAAEPLLCLSSALLTSHSDPFIEMEKHNKKYGYTIALWERGKTVPSLFRKVSDWKKAQKIRTTPLWNAMIDPSYAPWPIRRFLSLLRNRDAAGDLWNMCHFWSNFEIADMDFFRSPEYRKFFDFLDADGGFYYERVSGAPLPFV